MSYLIYEMLFDIRELVASLGKNYKPSKKPKFKDLFPRLAKVLDVDKW